MTVTSLQDKPPASARRGQNFAALSWLWGSDAAGRPNSSLPRVRACRLHVVDAEAGVTLRRRPDGSAHWSGLQSCGSTWACPVCADAIQAARMEDVRTMLCAAAAMGLTVGFLTFTVRHTRTQSLREVWDQVGDAWRRMTNGDPRQWNADRDEFGVVGYLRLWEVTYGPAGWHVHVHALVFLDPNGRTVVKRTPVPLADADLIGPLLEGQQRRRTRLEVTAALPRARHLRETCPPEAARFPCKRDDCPDAGDAHGHTWSYRRPEGPVPAPRLVADKRQHTRTGPEAVTWVPCARAEANHDADLDSDKPARVALYARDVQDLAASMFARWRAALPEGMAPPSACRDRDPRCVERRRFEGADHTHGYDARVVRDGDALAEYFTKNRLKSDGSTAHDVTGSTGKTSIAGNLTPFGILGRLVDGDHALRAAWGEWEATSRGRRQLRPSDGLRDFLGLGAEQTDDDLAAAAAEPETLTPAGDVAQAVDLVRLDGAGYRRLAYAGDHLTACALAEDWLTDALDDLLGFYGLEARDADVGLARRSLAPPGTRNRR